MESREEARTNLLSLFQQKPQSPEGNPPQELTNQTADANNPDPSAATDRQNALLSLLGTVGVKGGTPPPQQRASSVTGTNATSNNVGESQGKALLEQLMAGTLGPQQSSQQPQQIPLPSASPTQSIDQEQKVKSLFDFVSPFDGLGSGGATLLDQQQPPQPQQISQANNATVAPSPARKKPVPAYNPSPALAPVTSPHVSPNLSSIQQRLTPSPPPLRQLQQQQDSQQPLQPQPLSDSASYNEFRTNSRGSDPVEDFSRMGVQHGPLPAIPQGQQFPSGGQGPISLNQTQSASQQSSQRSPQSQTLSQQQRQQQNLQQLQQQLYPSPPLRPAHPPPAQRLSPPPQQQSYQNQSQQQQQQQQQSQQPQAMQSASRGRSSPLGPSSQNRNSGFVRDSQTSPASSSSLNIGQNVKRNAAAKASAIAGGPVGTNAYGQPPQNQQSQQAKGSRVSPEYRPSSSLQHSTITIDVLSPLQSTLAPQDIAEVTPIALLKLEPTYISGTTIGVANFIAYSMTRGRVRLIGRDSGTRALLRLPATFAQNASVQDMMVCGSKLACVTNDGGLVVWDVEGTIEDDKPVQFTIVLHVLPTPDSAGFKVVKWHPKQNGQLAVASEKEIYLVDIKEAHEAFGQEAVRQDELSTVAKVFSIPSPLVSFTFDVPQIALASISIDSTVTLWSIKDKLPFWSGRVAGEGYPSSIDFLEGGLLVGRNQGNVLQLLPIMSTTVLSTIKFVLGDKGANGKPRGPNGADNSGGSVGSTGTADTHEDLMFGHLSYDPAMKTLWVANSARSSLFAIKMGIESGPLPNSPTSPPSELPTIRPCFEQIVEFLANMPTINLTIVAEGDPAHSELWGRDPNLAVQAFSVHAGGVDQINIEKDAFEMAFARAPAKLPNISYETIMVKDRKSSVGAVQAMHGGSSSMPPPMTAVSSQFVVPTQQTTSHSQVRGGAEVFQQQQQQQRERMRNSPPVFGLGLGDTAGFEPPQPPSGLSNVQPPQAQAQVSLPPIQSQMQQLQTQSQPMGPGGPKGKGKEVASPPSGGRRQPGLAQVGPGYIDIPQQQQQQPQPQQQQQQPQPVMRGIPEATGGPGPSSSIIDGQTIVGGVTREIKKVEDSLHTRIGRLIVKELDKQQARLEEVRHADQTADFERQEKILKLISNELTKNTTRVVEQAVKSVVQNSVLPALETVTKAEVKAALNNQIAKGLSESMKQTLPTEVEKLLLRPDVSNHVARTFSQAITPLLERHVTDSVTKTLIPAYTQASNTMHQELSREIHSEMMSLKKEVVTWQSEALKGSENMIREMESSIRSLSEQVKMLSVMVSNNMNVNNNNNNNGGRSGVPSDIGVSDYLRQAPQSQSQQHNSFQSLPYSQSSWNTGLPSSTQSSQSSLVPQQQQQQAAPQPRQEDWDEMFLTNLGLQDPKKLRELLFRCNADAIMPNGQVSPLSQAVVLTLILRLALSLTELSPVDEDFKSTLWWLQRAAQALRPQDNVIAPYVERVLTTAQGSLNTTSQRLNLLPGGPSLLETSSAISQIQQYLNKLMM